ncbi:ATP-dependent 6-phosphofructokinase 6-like protein [Tanacetum coccineum]
MIIETHNSRFFDFQLGIWMVDASGCGGGGRDGGYGGGGAGGHGNEAIIAVQVYFALDEVHAAIVTYGGLCPGLNTIIRDVLCILAN